MMPGRSYPAVTRAGLGLCRNRPRRSRKGSRTSLATLWASMTTTTANRARMVLRMRFTPRRSEPGGPPPLSLQEARRSRRQCDAGRAVACGASASHRALQGPARGAAPGGAARAQYEREWPSWPLFFRQGHSGGNGYQQARRSPRCRARREDHRRRAGQGGRHDPEHRRLPRQA